MKRFLALLLGTLITAMVIASVIPTKFYIWINGISTAFDINDQELTYGNGTLTINGNTYELATIDSITFGEYTEVNDADTVYVTYDGSTATVSPAVNGVSVSISNADVTLTNENADREMTFVLSGSSNSGSFVYNGTYKTTIRLNGLTLTGSTAEAINIVDGKRIALELAGGTVNTLADASTDGGQKAAFYTKGHLEISGSGTLNLKGNIKHALSSKEYLLVKKTTGTINVTGAAKDGIHAGQYVQVNGGDITITGVGGDGIQAEMEEDLTEDDGKIIVKGGTLAITVTAADCAALKSDSTLHIKDGSLTLTTTGDADKGLKSKYNVDIEGGTITITQSGSYILEDMEPSYSTGIKANGDVNITGGIITLTNKAEAGRGASADGNLNVSEDDNTVTLTITNSGAGGELDTSKNVESGGSTTDEASYRVYVNVPTSSGGGGPGGGSKTWQNVYLYNSSGTQVATLSSSVTLTKGSTSKTFYYYDFKQSDSGTYYFASDSYQSGGGWGGGTTYTIQSGTFTGPTSGSDYFYVISSSYSTSGTVRTYSISDQTSTYSSYTKTSSSSDDYVSAKGLTADGNITLTAGTIKVTMTGDAGKGIKSDGTLVIGDKTTATGPTLTVSTTGSKLGSSSGGGGGFPGQEESSGSSAKAIKAQGTIYLYGGTSEICTATDGAEGLESKTAVYIEGGQHYLKCYDDCINSSGCIYFNGGVTICYSTGNDAVDSNAGKTGAITIGNGAVMAYTTKGSPEEGLDCDNNSYIQITGTGYAISAGASQGGGSSSNSISGAKQGYAFVTSTISYASGRYYTISDASNNVLVTYSFPTSVSSSLSLFTAKGMTSGTTYYIKYNTSAPTDANTAFHGLYLGSNTVGSNSVTSFSAK